MAYQTSERDPLLDPKTRAHVERAAVLFGGIVLIAFGVFAGLLGLGYSPEDPSWIVTVDTPVRNWLGPTGAKIAAPIFLMIGYGVLALAVIAIAWGLRCVFQVGASRFLKRFFITPFAVFAASIYASTLVPNATWDAQHFYGLGGQFGDLASHSLLLLVPMSSLAAIKILSVVAALAMLALVAYSAGVTWDECRIAARQFVHGLRVLGVGAVTVVGKSAQAGQSQWHAQAARRTERRRDRELAERAAAEQAEYELTEDWSDDLPDFDDVPLEQVTPDTSERKGLFARVKSAVSRSVRDDQAELPLDYLPDPELIENDGPDGYDEMPGDARIQAKISSAIRSRRHTSPTVQAAAEPDFIVEDDASLPAEPVLRRAAPDVTRSGSHPSARSEPPLHTPAQANASPTDFEDAPMDNVFAQDDVLGELDAATVPPVTPRVPVAQPRVASVESRSMAAPKPSRRAQAEAQPALSFGDSDDGFELPPLSLLANHENIERHYLSEEALQENARMLESVLDDYGVKGDIINVRPGPVVTMYELEPAPGLKASRVMGLSDDIARSMSALSARVSTVPGRTVIGIELPNQNREKVVLREILAAREFGDRGHALPLALGKDIGGGPVVANLAKMPHLLIAGTTGSGKSVAINTMILSLLYRLSPDECRLIMIDPKMLELSVYDGIPHLLSPVVTDPKKAVVALKWVVAEMEDRYRKMSKMGVRNIAGYNGRVQDALDKNEMFSRTVQTGFDDETGEPVFETEEFAPEKIPYIVVIVDEMADLMMVAGKEIEACIQRLAQMARASGIHLIMATQRPSVDVITGTIKANFPTRISFQVTSKVDSRTILGEMGAEQLLGMGDMLYMAGGAKITRCHGPFVSDEEVEEVVNHLKSFGPPEYVSTVLEGPEGEKANELDQVLGLGGNTNGEDALYDQAVAIVAKDRKCSTSYIQRKLGIGYNKAARLVEQMEDNGLVSPANHVGKRDILIPEAS